MSLRPQARPGLARLMYLLFAKLSVMYAVAQGPTLGPPPPFRAIVTVRGGGIDHDAPYRKPQRMVQGVIHDANNDGVARARVYLKDDRTSEVRVILADERGSYLFGGLPLTHDYQVWYEQGNRKTPAKAISSYFGSHDITLNFTTEDLRAKTPEELKAETDVKPKEPAKH